MSIVPRRELLEWEHKRLIAENNPRVTATDSPLVLPVCPLTVLLSALLYEGYLVHRRYYRNPWRMWADDQ